MQPPRMSVLIPLQDERESGADSVRAWTAQDADPGVFELVVVALGEDRELEREVRPLLRSEDRWIDLPGGDEYEAFNRAAEVARGEFVLVTEAHCIPEPDCLTEMLAELDRTAAPGIRGESVPLAVGAMGELERDEFADALELEREPEHWRKVLIHDTAIRRELYRECGGLPPDYGDFAPWVLAIALHTRGEVLVHSPRTRVRHVYDGDLEHLGSHVRSFGRGEMRYRSEQLDGLADRYLVHAEEWEQRLSLSRDGATRAVRAALALRHRGAVRPLMRHAGTVLFGARPEILRARLAAARAARRARRARDDGSRRASFREFWRQTSRRGRLEGLARWRPAPAPAGPPAERLDLCSPLAGRALGFHEIERPPGEPPLRWTDSLALLRVSVPGTGRRRARLELRPLERPGRSEPRPRVAVDGSPVPASYEPDALSFEVDAGEHWIALACTPLRPRELGVDDPRRLGLCVRALSFAAPSG
ncbi:MAG TPA: glycosyltransferase family 2 protein [Solirubrobacterales bacterium]|nr:glycosyltransferase family 2 protein [Solirubrobacterales bacterium]